MYMYEVPCGVTGNLEAAAGENSRYIVGVCSGKPDVPPVAVA